MLSVGNGQHPQCCSNPKEAYCGAQQCTHNQVSWNNPYIVSSGVRRCGFYSSENTTAFGPPGSPAPSSVIDLRQASLDSVVGRPTSWNFANRTALGPNLLGWSAYNAKISRLGGKLVGQVTAAESWLQSPPTWVNPFDTPLVELSMWADRPGVSMCLEWVTEADPIWDRRCTPQAAKQSGKSLRVEVPERSKASVVRMDLRDSFEWGGIITAFRLVLVRANSTPINVTLVTLDVVATERS